LLGFRDEEKIQILEDQFELKEDGEIECGKRNQFEWEGTSG
jgi:hypothetical protein